MKRKSNSVIDGLPANQREALEQWLFVEKISYEAASQRLWDDFAVKLGKSALCSWYQQREPELEREKMLAHISASRETANAVVKRFQENPADMYQALLDMAGQIAFDKAFQTGKEFDAETIYNFTKLVMEARKQEMESRKLNLAVDRFQFDAAKSCMKHLPALRAIVSNNALSETDKLTQIRLKLFGVTPG